MCQKKNVSLSEKSYAHWLNFWFLFSFSLQKSPAGVSIPLFKPCSLLLSADWLNQIPFIALVSLLVPLRLSVTFRAAFRPKLPLSLPSSLKKPCKHPIKQCQALNSLAWFHLSYPCSLPSGASPLAYKSQPAWMRSCVLCGGLGTGDGTWWQPSAHKTVFGWKIPVKPFLSKTHHLDCLSVLPPHAVLKWLQISKMFFFLLEQLDVWVHCVGLRPEGRFFFFFWLCKFSILRILTSLF